MSTICICSILHTRMLPWDLMQAFGAVQFTQSLYHTDCADETSTLHSGWAFTAFNPVMQAPDAARDSCSDAENSQGGSYNNT